MARGGITALLALFFSDMWNPGFGVGVLTGFTSVGCSFVSGSLLGRKFSLGNSSSAMVQMHSIIKE